MLKIFALTVLSVFTSYNLYNSVSDFSRIREIYYFNDQRRDHDFFAITNLNSSRGWNGNVIFMSRMSSLLQDRNIFLDSKIRPTFLAEENIKVFGKARSIKIINDDLIIAILKQKILSSKNNSDGTFRILKIPEAVSGYLIISTNCSNQLKQSIWIVHLNEEASLYCG